MATSSQTGSRVLEWTPNLLSRLRLTDEYEQHERNRKKERRRERKRQIDNALIPLPSTRSRTLSLPLPEDSPPPAIKQTTYKQSQSRLFNKLPPEIRTKIYLYVLGGDMIRVLKEERSRYVRWIGQTKNLLALLRTCRFVYTEAINLLYSQNTFFFNDLDTICWFASTILPHRFNVIRSLSIEWDCICFWHPRIKPPPPYDEATWHQVWRIISGMKGLRELRIVVWNGPKMDPDTETEVFSPLRAVTAPTIFTLELPWEYMGNDENPHADAPFRISRVKRKYDPDP